MRAKIVYDAPGRIRLRGGADAFEKTAEAAIEQYALKNEWALDCEAHYENGGILLTYKKGCREKALQFVRELVPAALEPVSPSGYDVKEIDRTFKSDLIKLIADRYVKKALLPSPISKALIIYSGLKYIVRGISTLFDGKLTVEVLDGASIGACLAQKNYNTAGTVMFLLSVSALLEDYTRARTKAALTDSLAIKADKVWLADEGDGPDLLIPMSELKAGDCIRVRTGSVIPVDGEVTDGEAYVNEATMTGEPLAVMKSAGSSVFAGTVIDEGSIVIKVRSLSSDTKISRIIELIDNSENLKAGVQSKAERLADSIVPYSFLGFILTLALTRNVTKAVSVLMVDYSCAIKLSTPIAVISAIKQAADCDITVKGGKYLEEFALADSIVFDKTGTLTNAEPVLEKVIALGDYSEEDTLKIAACLEEHFPHSVARAIVKGATARGIDHAEEHAEVQYIVAHGISTTLHGKPAVIGSKHFICEDEGVEITEDQQREIDEKSGACSVVYLAVGGKLTGALCISDPPRAEAKRAVEMLKESGIENIVMLTGDSAKAAEITAEKLGITSYRAQVLPEDKHSWVERLKEEGHRVIMVGDGINDAPALAAANVSAAMSDASDIARETADITLRGADLTELARIRRLSEALMARINSNYRFILWFNSALLAGGALGLLAPSWSALLHNASTMAICAKSMTPLKDSEK